METKNNKVIIDALKSYRRQLLGTLDDYMKNGISKPMYEGTSSQMSLQYSKNNVAENGGDSIIFLASKVSLTLQEFIKSVGEVDETIKGLK